MVQESWQTGFLGSREKTNRGERMLLGETEGAWCEACSCGGQRELGKGEKEAAGARSDFDGRGVARAAGATPCSFTHRSQSGPHPHLQCRTVPIGTVDRVPATIFFVQGTASLPPAPLLPIVGSLARLAHSHPGRYTYVQDLIWIF